MTPRVVIMANNIDELGGAQRVSHTLAEGLAQRGYDVTLVGLIPKPPVHRYVDAPGYRVRTLLDEPRDTRRKDAQQQRIESQLTELLAEGEPGILITAQVWCMEHVLRVPHAGWRSIGQYHSSFQAAKDDGDLARLTDSYLDVDWFTVLSHGDERLFTSAGFNNCITMVNPLDSWPPQTADGSARTITVLGRLSWEKAPGVALAAWARIADCHPDWTLQFVGSGPLADAIAATSAPRVRMVPPTDHPMDVLATSGIFCLPSLVEGLPMSLLEAMACGLPVVAADCSPGVREAVGDAGVLVPTDRADEMAEALHRLIENAERRADLGAAARHAAAAYRTAKVIDRWEWLIAQTLR